MTFDVVKVGFCGIIIFGEALVTDGSRTYSITMEQPAPYYTPKVATVPAGYPIRWNNKTATVHTATHDGCLTGEACAFDSGPVPAGKSYTLPFLQPGSYPYYCRLHPIMRGTILVIEANVDAADEQHMRE